MEILCTVFGLWCAQPSAAIWAWCPNSGITCDASVNVVATSKRYCEAYGEERRLEKSQGWTCHELRPQ